MTVIPATGTGPSEVFELHDVSMSATRELRDEWNRLAAQCSATSYFQTADWVLGWWDTVAGRIPTRVACWRAADGSLEAIAAVSDGRVTLHRRLGVSVPAVILAGSGPGDADHCGAIARPERRADVARWLRDAGSGRTVVATGLAPGAGIAPSGARHVESNPCPRLDLSTVDGGVGRSANFRSQLDRFGRRIARAGVTFEWKPPGTVEPVVVIDLFQLHWCLRRSRDQSSTLDARLRDLLLECVDRADGTHGPAAVIARKGDAVVGVLLGFWWRGCFSAFQKGWDPAYARYSLGSLLVSEAIVGSKAGGAETFDFLRGTEDYKYRFGAVDRDDETVVVAAGTVGALVRTRAFALAQREARSGR